MIYLVIWWDLLGGLLLSDFCFENLKDDFCQLPFDGERKRLFSDSVQVVVSIQ